MNVSQSNHTQKSTKTQNPQLTEIEPSQTHAFDATLIQAGLEIDLFSTEEIRADREKTEKEEIRKDTLKKDQYLDQVQENKAFAVLKLESLESVLKEQMMAKKETETETAGKLHLKKDNYVKVVKKNIAEGKSNLAAPVQDDPASQSKNEFLEKFRMAEGKAAETKLEGKLQQDPTRGEYTYKNISGAFATTSKDQGLQKFNNTKEQNATLNSKLSTASITQKISTGSDKGENKTQNQTSKNNLLSSDKLTAVQAKEASKTEAFETQLKAKINSPRTKQEADIEAVLGKVKVMMSADKSEMVIKLTPAHLGKLELKLKKRDEGRLIAELKVDSPETGEILKNQLDEFKQGLEEQGVMVDEFTLLVTDENGSGGSFSSAGGSSEQNSNNSDTPDRLPSSAGALNINAPKPENYSIEQSNDSLDIIV